VRERNGEVGLGLGPAEVERNGVVGARRHLGGVEGADPHALPLSQAIVAAATKTSGHAWAVCGDHQASWSMGAPPELSPELELLVWW
jgi:hypothetical protein